MKRIALALAALTLLAGCGIRGALEQPAPMWGSDREAYERDREAAQRAQAEREARTTTTTTDTSATASQRGQDFPTAPPSAADQ